MKFDLFSAIGVAIVGVCVGFFVTNMLVPEIKDFTFKTIDDAANAESANGYNYADVKSPDPEVFNYEALNPTVEVYVGECEEYDQNGECIEQKTEDEQNGENGNGEEGDEASGENEFNIETNEQENG